MPDRSLLTFNANLIRDNGLFARDISSIPEIADPPKPSGLVLTQVKSMGSHVQYHPVFKCKRSYNEFGTPSEPDTRMLEKGKDGETCLRGLTSLIYRANASGISEPSVAEERRRMSNVVTGFLGVCVSNTRVMPHDLERGSGRAVKRRKREDPRMTVAVAGTVTMPFFKGGAGNAGDGSVIQPGDLVAFAVPSFGKFQASDIRVLEGTQGLPFPEYLPRIRKFDEAQCNVPTDTATDFKDNCTAPFGVCTAINEDEHQITVLLRMDLYHSYFYDFTKKATF